MDRTGQIIGEKYRLVRLLGEGGMGAVYEAQHSLIGRRCAVKFLHAECARQPEIAQRFMREAQAASAIGHPGIIDIYDFGVAADGAPYLVMEFLAGDSVAKRIERSGKVPIPQAAEIAAQTLSALAMAHRRGIVHRDLKPDNLQLLQVPGMPTTIKILDFGISKMTLAGDPAGRMTQTGAVLGTPLYMAPEQAAGRTDVDSRIDIYAMGVIVFELVTGCVPFAGANFNQILVAILTQPFPSPRTVLPDMPAAFEAVIMKATAREREDRYASAEAMLHDLLPFLDAGARARLGLEPDALAFAATTAVPVVDSAVALVHTEVARAAPRTAAVGPAKGRRGLVIGVGIAAAAALVVGVVLWTRQPGPSPGEGDLGAAAVADVGSAPPAAVAGTGPVFPTASPPAVAPPVAVPVESRVDVVPSADAGVVVTAVPATGDAGGVSAVEGPVTIDVAGLPPGAQVLWAGGPVAQVPFEVPRSSALVWLEVRVPGYEPFRQEVSPVEDVRLAPAFQRVAGREGPGTVAAPASPPADAGPATPPPPPPPPPETKTGGPPATIVHGSHGTVTQTVFQ
ncbi:MAG: serine/threonine protein kinase [Deltaproteobacteria bacterium]|nr:serine/threonine protein kinase [Deltaproteobacteria bacterium]